MFNAISKDGTRIVGTLERISARAETDDGAWTYVGNPPVIGFVWAGETEVFWDTQETEERDGSMIYLDADGGEWLDIEIAIVDEDDIELVKEALEFPHVSVDRARYVGINDGFS